LVRESETLDTETGEVTTAAHVLSLFELQHRDEYLNDSPTE